MDLQDSFPGCMGRLINFFDLSTGITRTKMLTQRPHTDVVRNCTTVANKPACPIGSMKESKHATSEQSSSSTNKKSGGMPIKKLISEEMMGDIEFKQKLPSVVARLMGLDSLPVQKSVIINQKVRNKGNLWDDLTDVRHSQQQEHNYFDQSMECNDQPFFHEEAFRDVYEAQQQPPESVCFERYQQKLNEAKRMLNDEKCIDLKEFKDAVNVYSNRDLFFEFLDRPNSLLAKHLFELQRVQITLLKPFNIIEEKSEKYVDRQSFAASTVSSKKANNHSWISSFSEPKGRSLSQSTRIVVLKPSPWKADSLKTKHPKNMPTLLDGRVSNGAMTNDKLTNAREVAKEIAHPIQESPSSNKDELFLSSVLSNGYIGDESSFNGSGSEDIEGDIGCTCGTERTTTAKEYFCDYMNKNGSPFSISSFTRQSHSPESSVFREAKRRLSEKLALVSSNDICQEQKELQRASSTLGELLAIPQIQSEGNKDEFDLSSSKSSNAKSSRKVSSSRFEDEFPGEYSHGSLSKSKPVSLSSSACQVLIGKPIVQVVIPTSNSGMPSFKDIFSSFFFSKSKKPSRGNSIRPPSKDEEETKRTVNQSAIATCHGPQNCYVTDVSVSEEIRATLRSKLSGQKCVPHDSMSIDAMVDILVKDEVIGREWTESILMEDYEFCKDIAEMALVELLEQELPEL